MKYKNVIKGEFISRPNRFIAQVLINGVIETVHVKNTGRCKELLIDGAEVFLSVCDNQNRKTKYDLIAVRKSVENGSILINMDSQIPNDVAFEWIENSGIFSEFLKRKREVAFGSSRFDLFVEDGKRKAFVEVKGVTLENNGIAMFPDAPTERGIKHVMELVRAVKMGYEAYVLFVIQMKGVSRFIPNVKTHPEFAYALRQAEKEGVKIIAVDCIVEPDEITIDREVLVELQ